MLVRISDCSARVVCWCVPVIYVHMFAHVKGVSAGFLALHMRVSLCVALSPEGGRCVSSCRVCWLHLSAPAQETNLAVCTHNLHVFLVQVFLSAACP